ncbi:MAG TPA: tetratricopeptide repeat protein [Pontiella sp.]
MKNILLTQWRDMPHSRQTPIMNHQPNMALCLAIAALLFLAVAPGRAEETPRSAMRKGLKSYHRGDYTNAVGLLEKTVLEFPDIGNYNLGNAQYRAGNYEAAAETFNEALRTTDLELQAKAYFNRGNALLARITELTGQDQIRLAVELSFQAVDMYEKSLLLEPEDLAAKQNYERAQQLRLNLEYNLGKWYFERAESLLQEYRAKEAQSHYHQARQQFNHILENVEPHHEASRSYLPQIEERLSMLIRAVEEAESDLAVALQQVDDYQYMLAAQRLTTESDERKYAFDLKPDLKKRYEETIQKNQDVLEIIRELTTLNIVE